MRRWLPQSLQDRICNPVTKLCVDCRYYVPERGILGCKPNPRWAECAHPTSFEPPGEPNPVDGSVPPQQRLRCIEARSTWCRGRNPCGPEAQYWEPR